VKSAKTTTEIGSASTSRGITFRDIGNFNPPKLKEKEEETVVCRRQSGVFPPAVTHSPSTVISFAVVAVCDIPGRND